MSENNEIIWSWSKINSFRQGLDGDEGCLYSWYLTYVLGDRGESNFFAEYGSLAHNIIERYQKNEIFDWDIENELENGLTNLQHKAPFPKMRDSYYRAIRNFFYGDDFTGKTFADRFKRYRFLENELEVKFKVEDINIKGYIDAVVEHDDHGFCVLDFKSSKPYTGDKLKNNIMQLYLYSIGVKEKYGKYPDKLIYYYFKESPKREYPYIFEMNELQRTIDFVKETVKLSKEYLEESQFSARCLTAKNNDFYCTQLCNHRFYCQYSLLNQK